MPDVINWFFLLAVLLFITGFVLIGIEMVTPGLHAPGFFGAGCLLAAIFIISDTFMEGALITIVVLLLLGVMLAIVLGLLSSGKLKSPIILDEVQNREKGYLSSKNRKDMMGKQGIALTDLRPSGRGKFDDSDYDVISDGKYIVKDAKIIIYQVQGSKLLVKELEE